MFCLSMFSLAPVFDVSHFSGHQYEAAPLVYRSRQISIKAFPFFFFLFFFWGGGGA